MKMKKVLTLQDFQTLAPIFADKWEEAKLVFKKYGDHLSIQSASVLYIAAQQHKLKEVIIRMNQHFNTHLTIQKKEVRGLNDEKTKMLFAELHKELSSVPTV